MLVTGELYPSKRILKDGEGKEVKGEVVMENVEHLGQYVFEMTNVKVQQLRAEKGLPVEMETEGQGEQELIGAPAEEELEEVMQHGFAAEEVE